MEEQLKKNKRKRTYNNNNNNNNTQLEEITADQNPQQTAQHRETYNAHLINIYDLEQQYIQQHFAQIKRNIVKMIDKYKQIIALTDFTDKNWHLQQDENVLRQTKNQQLIDYNQEREDFNNSLIQLYDFEQMQEELKRKQINNNNITFLNKYKQIIRITHTYIDFSDKNWIFQRENNIIRHLNNEEIINYNIISI